MNSVTFRVLGVCGSLQAKSSNLDLLRTAIRLAPPGMEIVLSDEVRDLPLFNPDIEAAGAVPASVAAWREALKTSDAVLVATPEYGHSLPGALKNAIDWTIGSGEFYQKTIAITSAAAGRGRGRQGLDALRATLGAVSAVVVGGEPIVRGASFERDLTALLSGLLQELRAGRHGGGNLSTATGGVG